MTDTAPGRVIPNEDIVPPPPGDDTPRRVTNGIRAGRNTGPRVPPHDLAAEASLLGACLLPGLSGGEALPSTAIIAALGAGLEAEDFYKPAHGHIWGAVRDLHVDGVVPDPVTVADRLHRDHLLEHVGGPAYLIELTTGAAYRSNADRYARIVADHAEGRAWLKAAAEIADLAYAMPSNPAAVAAAIQTQVSRIVEHAARPTDVVDIVSHELGVSGRQAYELADDVGRRIRTEQAQQMARRMVRDAQVVREADLDTIIPISVADLLDYERPPRIPMFGQLLAEGHNATVVARWKVGKSTLVDNAAAEAAAGGMFLGRFDAGLERRVVLFNYELHEDDMADRLNAIAMPAHARQNIVVVNLRGHRLPIQTPAGRDLCVRILDNAGADLWIVDPFGAAFAASGGDDENNNAEVRRFLIALDEIKRLADCSTMLMPVHTGRANAQEGDEQGRGATVLEDWPDVRMVLTRGQKEQAAHRFLRTEGRAWELDESRLTFDERTRRLTLAGTDVGVSRRRAKDQQHARIVAELVTANAGANVRSLNELLSDHGVTNKTEMSKAIEAARGLQLVHFHTDSGSHRYFTGGVHPDADPCPGGFKP